MARKLPSANNARSGAKGFAGAACATQAMLGGKRLYWIEPTSCRSGEGELYSRVRCEDEAEAEAELNCEI